MALPYDELMTLNPATGADTVVGSNGQFDVAGLVGNYGTLFGARPGGTPGHGVLMTINAATGAGTVLITSGPTVEGLASPPNRA